MERGKEWTEDEIYKMLKAEEEKKEKRIKRRNKKPEYMRMVQTNEGETKIFCWYEGQPDTIEILLEIKGKEEYITRDTTIKEFEYLHNAIRNGTQPHKIQRGRGNN